MDLSQNCEQWCSVHPHPTWHTALCSTPGSRVLLLSCCRRDAAAFPSTFTLLHLENVPVKQQACPNLHWHTQACRHPSRARCGMAAGRGETRLLGKGKSQALAL